MPSQSSTARHPVRALLGQGSIYTVALAVQLSSSLITLPLVTRLLAPAQYGIVALAVLVTLLLGAVCAGGLPTVISRTFFAEADGPAESRRLILSATVLAAGTAAIADLTSPLWLPVLGHIRSALALHLAIWTAVPSALTGLCQGYFRASERPLPFVTLAIVSALGGQVLGVLLTATLPGADASTYVAGLGSGYLIAGVIGLAVVRPWRDGLASGRSLRESLAIGVPIVPHNIAWTILALGDRAVIQRVDGSTAVARYQVAYTTGALALSLVSSVANAWMPIVYAAAEKLRWQVHNDTLMAVQVMAAFVASGLALAGPPLLRVLTPASYHEARLAGVVALVAVSAFPWAIYGGATQVLLWYKRTRALAWITPLAAVLNVALVAVLLHPLGLTGAALATLVAYGLLALLVRRALGSRGVMRNFQWPIVVAWCATAPLAVLGGTAPSAGGWLAVRGVVAASVAVGFVLTIRRLIAPQPALDPVDARSAVPLLPGS